MKLRSFAVALAISMAGAPAFADPVEGPGGRSLPVPLPTSEPVEPPMLAPPIFVPQGDTVRLEVALPPDAPFQERSDAKQWRLVLPGLRPPAGLPSGRLLPRGVRHRRAGLICR